MQNPHVYLSTNAEGTLNLPECMREKTGAKSLFLPQPPPCTPGKICHGSQKNLSVNEPLSPYAASKKAGELMAYSYHKLYQMDVSVVRYFTVFGPGRKT